MSALVAQEHKLPGPNVRTIFLNQHKYHARVAQLEHVPEATPLFDILLHSNNQIKNRFEFSFFLKPIKSAFSVFAFKIMSEHQLSYVLEHAKLPESFINQFNSFIESYTNLMPMQEQFLQERLLEGVQCTLEAYVYNNVVTIIGVVDSIMHEGTIAFERFTYPSRLPDTVFAKNDEHYL